jgi:hypothetical protein
MTWSDYQAALLLLAEERIGSRLRAGQRAEDAAVARSFAGLKKDRDGTR